MLGVYDLVRDSAWLGPGRQTVLLQRVPNASLPEEEGGKQTRQYNGFPEPLLRPNLLKNKGLSNGCKPVANANQTVETMKGHVRKRGKRSWAVIVDLGRDANGKRRQKWITVQGTRRDADRECARIIHEMETGAFVEPSRMSLRDYLGRWLDHASHRWPKRLLSVISN